MQKTATAPIEVIRPPVFCHAPVRMILGFLMVPFFGLELPLLFYLILQRRLGRLELYPDRVLSKRGRLSKTSAEVRIGEIQTVRVRQSLAQRIIGLGDVAISGRSAVEIGIRGIRNPNAVRDRIEAMRGMAVGTPALVG